MAFTPLDDESFPDAGCKHHPLWGTPQASCLTCPLPQCVEDGGGEERRAAQLSRDQQIVLRHRELCAAGHRNPTRQTAGEFGISRRSIARVLQHASDSEKSTDDGRTSGAHGGVASA